MKESFSSTFGFRNLFPFFHPSVIVKGFIGRFFTPSGLFRKEFGAAVWRDFGSYKTRIGTVG